MRNRPSVTWVAGCALAIGCIAPQMAHADPALPGAIVLIAGIVAAILCPASAIATASRSMPSR